ncbi:MAG: OmpH family outer membrane protein [Prevotellaceae bacterium]|jgi:outer membrane protein|nr:OmpH family outer membrane protein [Prevotellaceae bacterium]
MKKNLPAILLSIAFSAVVSFAVAALFLYIGLGSKVAATGNDLLSEDGQSTIAGEGVVYVNIDSLVRGYDMYFDLQNEFEAKAKKKDGDFTARMKKFESDARDFQEKVEKGLVTRSQAQQLQEGLAKREQELLQLRQQLQSELQEEESVMLRQIQNNIQTYINEYNKDKKHSLILSTSGSNVVLYGNPELNITSEVLAGLNDTYVKARKSK